MAHITRWHWANAKKQSSLLCLVKEISNSRTASRTKCIIKLPFRNKFQKCVKNKLAIRVEQRTKRFFHRNDVHQKKNFKYSMLDFCQGELTSKNPWTHLWLSSYQKRRNQKFFEGRIFKFFVWRILGGGILRFLFSKTLANWRILEWKRRTNPPIPPATRLPHTQEKVIIFSNFSNKRNRKPFITIFYCIKVIFNKAITMPQPGHLTKLPIYS